MKTNATRTMWSFERGQPKEAAIRITRGNVYLCIPMSEIRALVDICHDKKDDHDRELRETNNHG